MEHRIHTAGKGYGEPVQCVFVGQGTFVDADEIGGESLLQFIKPLLYPIVNPFGIHRIGFSVLNCNTGNLGKRQHFEQLVDAYELEDVKEKMRFLNMENKKEVSAKMEEIGLMRWTG